MLKKLFKDKKMAVFYAVVLLITYISTTLFFTPYLHAVKAVTYSYGSRGDPIIELQTRLKRWGYYNGSIDGIYGYATYKAVKYFQSTNGLTADGVAGNSTLAALGFNVGAPSSGGAPAATGATNVSNDQNLRLLSMCINGEARGEPYEGMVAVGAVILNRTRDPRFPSTIAGVIYQPGAFTATVDGQMYVNIEQSSINAARDALNGWDPSGGAIYYYNPAKTTNAWIWSRPLIKIIGSHRFCK